MTDLLCMDTTCGLLIRLTSQPSPVTSVQLLIST